MSNEWTDVTLDDMRSRGDDVADAVIAELFSKAETGSVNQLLRSLITNEFPEPAALPPIVREYLTGTDRLPEWADATQIQAGENLFWRYGPKQILILNCYALPWDYLGQKGVHVLTLTTRLLSNPTRRITEISQLLVDVMQPGGLTTPGGRGRRSIQKVRLMHAAVRKLAAESPDWNPAWDLPINQEDLAGTLMSFSWIVLDGLEKLGAVLTSVEREAYLHCWKVIGHLLGIRNELLPKNFDSARDLAAAIARRQFGPSSEGKALTKALVDMMAQVLPGDVFKHVAPLLIRYFLGKEHASWLGIENSDPVSLIAGPLRALGIHADACEAFRTKQPGRSANAKAELLILCPIKLAETPSFASRRNKVRTKVRTVALRPSDWADCGDASQPASSATARSAILNMRRAAAGPP